MGVHSRPWGPGQTAGLGSVLAAAIVVTGLAPAGTAADYAAEVIQDRPVAWWRFQDTGAAGSGTDTTLASGPGLNDGHWHHVVWTRSAEGMNALYVDGVLVDQAEDDGGAVHNPRPIQIGGDPHQRGSFLDGSLAEVAVYAVALPAERVRAHALAGGLPLPAAPAAEGTGTGPLETLALANAAGVGWEWWRGAQGWCLGQISLQGTPLASQAKTGAFALRHTASGEVHWLAAQRVERRSPTEARFFGEGRLGEATLRFSLDVALAPTLPAASWAVSWSVDRGLDGWEVCLMPWERLDGPWRGWLYPFAENRSAIAVTPLRYCGVPAMLLYRPDLAMAMLFGMDPTFDYLNPTTWTGRTGLHFASLHTAPQFRVSGPWAAGTDYRVPLQCLASGAGASASAITALVNDWLELNRYAVQPLQTRTPDEALATFVTGRRSSRMWRPGKGYQIQDAWPVIYLPESPINAYLDYRLYEMTGDRLWRDRAFETLDFVQRGQHLDPADPQFGAIESHYHLEENVFASTDRGGNPGLKPDMNAFAARYVLQLWERVRKKEGLDRQDWRTLGVRLADWVAKQQRPDGGFPQVVGPDLARNAVSVVSGRVLVAMPVVRRITGEARYDALVERHERFVRQAVEGRFWFTGAHTDLPPGDYEADSVWQVVEYWLDKHERSGDPESLARAEADALLAFLMMCPKQLPWVRNPTQTAHAEQQHYLQYSNYCYTNAKVACLHRLGRLTGRPLYRDLCARVIQCGIWAQETEGLWAGAQYERMSDPWRCVSQEVDSKGTRYMSELAVDLHLQLIELGLADLGGRAPGTRPVPAESDRQR